MTNILPTHYVSMSVEHLVHILLTVYNERPRGSNRHIRAGRPRHAWIGMQDPTNSATHGTRWFPGHVLRWVVINQQDMN